MELRDDLQPISEILVTEPAETAGRRALTAEHIEPWNGNVVDVTMIDGTHRVGLLVRIEGENARLREVRLRSSDRVTPLPDGGLFRIADAVSIQRAARSVTTAGYPTTADATR